MLESVGDGIFALDLEGRITLVNPAAAQMLGYRQEEILGRNMHELIHHTRAGSASHGRARSRQLDISHPSRTKSSGAGRLDYASRVVRDEVFWRKRLAPSFPVASTSADAPCGERRLRIRTESANDTPGRAVGVVVAFTDISERNALDRMKDEFISTVSHELRTPLTSLRAALGLVSGGALNARPEKMRQMMEIAIGNTDRLVRLVNDILDLERIGSGKAELHSRPCAASTISSARDGQHQTARIARPTSASTSKRNGVVVWADPDRILQTLNNLISNAIKFSPQASRFTVDRLIAHSTPDEALIEVRDHGRGIPADKLQQIFERFKQVDASDSRAMGGTGLGLAICRSIVSSTAATSGPRARSAKARSSTSHCPQNPAPTSARTNHSATSYRCSPLIRTHITSVP